MTVTSLSPASIRLAVARDRPLAILFTATVFLAAVLVFLVQPMVAKGLLPLFGGTPAVWTAAMLFFQAALLGGYGLAHLTLSRLGPRRQSRVQLVVLATAVLVLPLTGPSAAPDGDPLISVLVLLGAGVGLPFVALSTASPVLQRWFSVSGHSRAGNPYTLYVASNLGSLIALIAYPLLIEPNLSLDAQRAGWSALYVVLLGLAAACVLVVFPVRDRAAAEPELDNSEPTAESINAAAVQAVGRMAHLRQRGGWLVLAFIPSSLMLGVTAYLTTDIASVPFLWIVPLALYLLSFVVAFSRFAAGATRVASIVLPVLVVAAALDMIGPEGLPVALKLPLHVGLFSAAAILCHGRLAAAKPPVTRLTEFYLIMALGGVCGGVLNAIAAPLVLDVVAEYPLMIGVALLARQRVGGGARRRWTIGAIAAAVFLAAAAIPVALGVPGAWANPALVVAISLPLLVLSLPIPFAGFATVLLMVGVVYAPSPLFAERNFFGLVRVLDVPGEHVLVHGTTVHGTQRWPPEGQPQPSGYYHSAGPLGDLMHLESAQEFSEIGIIGLGSGGIAAYGEAGQHITFFEIDPAMIHVAQESRYFTYVSSSPAEIDVQLGDGRLLVSKQAQGTFDLLLVDAYSSDSVPVHLLTREAIELYVDRLAERGLLVVHVSSRYIDLGPVLSASARDLGLVASIRRDPGETAENSTTKRPASHWVVMARDAADLSLLPPTWSVLPPTSRPAWTDNFSDLISVINWTGQQLR